MLGTVSPSTLKYSLQNLKGKYFYPQEKSNLNCCVAVTVTARNNVEAVIEWDFFFNLPDLGSSGCRYLYY